MLNCCDCEELLDKNMYTFPDTPSAQTAPILSVTALNRLVRQTLEQRLPLTWVAGEISNLMRASSGHLFPANPSSGDNISRNDPRPR